MHCRHATMLPGSHGNGVTEVIRNIGWMTCHRQHLAPARIQRYHGAVLVCKRRRWRELEVRIQRQRPSVARQFFFFQAEDGIRDADVTGVQTCALPISVPPSPPSTTIKSGFLPVASMALTMANHSHGWPIASLKPTGLPPESSRNWSRNSNSSTGLEKAEWLAGDMQSSPI